MRVGERGGSFQFQLDVSVLGQMFGVFSCRGLSSSSGGKLTQGHLPVFGGGLRSHLELTAQREIALASLGHQEAKLAVSTQRFHFDCQGR